MDIDLQSCRLYADYIMLHGDPSERVICNGTTLLDAMSDGYLFEDFLKLYGIEDTDTFYACVRGGEVIALYQTATKAEMHMVRTFGEGWWDCAHLHIVLASE